jgi:hypothetical protein
MGSIIPRFLVFKITLENISSAVICNKSDENKKTKVTITNQKKEAIHFQLHPPCA